MLTDDKTQLIWIGTRGMLAKFTVTVTLTSSVVEFDSRLQALALC